MDLKNISYKNHRNIWRSEAFLREFFHVSEKDNVYKDNRVRNFLFKLKQIEVKETYTFVGYGSILNESDVKRTLTSCTDHRWGFVNGYKRVFNVGFQTAYLNVEKQDQECIEVALMDFKYYDIPRLINREMLYDFIKVDTSDGDALMVIGEDDYIDYTLTPQLNYLHLCLTGAMNLGGFDMVNNFLDYTYCYCQVKGESVTAREYLNNLNLINYMIKNGYSSR